MIQTNTVNCSIQELAKIALEHNLYVSDNWCLKGILTRILNNDHTESQSRIWIAYRASKPVGIAVLSGFDSSLMFYVKNKYRRQGIASKLLIEVELDRTIEQFKVSQGNKTSIKFFNKLGLSPSINVLNKTTRFIRNKWKTRHLLKEYKQNNYTLSRGMSGTYSV